MNLQTSELVNSLTKIIECYWGNTLHIFKDVAFQWYVHRLFISYSVLIMSLFVHHVTEGERPAVWTGHHRWNN